MASLKERSLGGLGNRHRKGRRPTVFSFSVRESREGTGRNSSSELAEIVDDREKALRRFLHRSWKATSLGFARACYAQGFLATVAVVGVVAPIYIAGGEGSVQGNSTSAGGTVPSPGATFSLASSGCNLLFAIVAPLLVKVCEITFETHESVIAASAFFYALVGLLVRALSLAFVVRLV